MTPMKDLADKRISLTYKMIATVIACTVSMMGSIVGGCIYIVKNIEKRDYLNATQSTQIAALGTQIERETTERKEKDKEHDDRINNFIEYITAPKR